MPSARDLIKAIKAKPELRAAFYSMELRALGVVEGLFDSRYNVRTRSSNVKPTFADDEGYDPISYAGLQYISQHVPIASGEVLADIGCGKGRAVCLFARHRSIARCVGIEYLAEHAESARRNAAQVRGRLAPILILEGDAAEQDYAGITLAFVFNPFGEPTMRRTLEAIARSLREHPRPFRMVYVNPKFEHVLEEQAWLEKVETFSVPNRLYRSLPASLWHSRM